MRFIVIACIRDINNKIVQLRVLDTEAKVFKDINIENIRRYLINGDNIGNIELKRDNVEGSNGDFDRYPTIKNGELVNGYSPMVILSKVGLNKFRACDFKGDIRIISKKDAIEYANKNGIANGTLYKNADGKLNIRSIKGSYKIEGDIDRKGNNKYSGTYIGESKSKKYSLIKFHSNFELVYVDNKIHFLNNDIFKNYKRHEIGGIVDGYNTCKGVIRALEINDSNYEELKYLIENYSNIRALADRNSDGKIEIATITILDKYKKTVKLKDSAIKVYIEKLKRVTRLIGVKEELNKDKKLLLCRDINSKGISYDVYTDSLSKIGTDKLEDIARNIDTYLNVKQTAKGTLIIDALDGVYEYDMDTYNESYKTKKIETRKCAKAKILGVLYEEDLTESGVLRKIRTDSSVIEIDDNIKYLEMDSIVLRDKNKVLIIGKSVVGCKAGIVKLENSEIPLERIELGCSDSVSIRVFKFLERYKKRVKHKITIEFKRDITAVEFVGMLDFLTFGVVDSKLYDIRFKEKYGIEFAEKVRDLLIKLNDKRRFCTEVYSYALDKMNLKLTDREMEIIREGFIR